MVLLLLKMYGEESYYILIYYKKVLVLFFVWIQSKSEDNFIALIVKVKRLRLD